MKYELPVIIKVLIGYDMVYRENKDLGVVVFLMGS